MALNKETIINLIRKAKEARKFSYSPYSKFKVGAAVLCENGDIYTGTNVENCSYGLCVCAERIAIFKAVTEGNKDLKALAVVIPENSPGYPSPCGACRQVMAEFSLTMPVIMAKSETDYQIATVEELLAYPFSPKNLDF
jgi:cytidine deaminase